MEVTVKADLGHPPVFIRNGAALVLASTTPPVRPHDAPARSLYLAAATSHGIGAGRHFEDDGVSWPFRNGHCLKAAIDWHWNENGAEVTLAGTGTLPTPPQTPAWSAEPVGATDLPVRMTMRDSAG